MNRSWVVRALGVSASAWSILCGLPVIVRAAPTDMGVLTDGGTDMLTKPVVTPTPAPTTVPDAKEESTSDRNSSDCKTIGAPAAMGSALVLTDSRIWPEQGIRWKVPANQNPASLVVTKICLQAVSDEQHHCFCAAGHRAQWKNDEKSTYLLLPLDQKEVLQALPPLRPWTALFPQKWTVAVEYQLGPGASKQTVSSAAEIEVTRRDSAALVAAMVVVLLLMLGGVLARRRVRSDAGPDAKLQTAGLIDSCLSLITTPLGTYSLSMMQVLVWTSITLFGYIFLWLLTSGTPTIPEQILGLLGVGTSAAMLSRLANGEKQSLPLRYLTLVPRAERPQWSDLINLDGRPSLFKFQMLGFTIATALVILRELYVGGRFADISPSLVLLMGLSSASYVGSESLQSRPWSLVKKQVEQIEQLAKGLNVSVATREALQQLLRDAKAVPPTPSNTDKERAELYQALLLLEDMLTDLYSDRPSEANPVKPPPVG